MAKDYVPSGDKDFNDWFKLLNQYVAQKSGGSSPAWTHIPAAARTALAEAYASWFTAYGATLGPHTPVDTEAKNGAKAAARDLIRPFVNQYLRYPPVSNEDRTAMGIPNKDTIPTTIPPPQAQAEGDITFPGVHLVELANIRPVGSFGAPDLRSDYGVRIYYGFSGPASEKYKFRLTGAPKTGSELPYSVFTRRKKERFDSWRGLHTLRLCRSYKGMQPETNTL